MNPSSQFVFRTIRNNKSIFTSILLVAIYSNLYSEVVWISSYHNIIANKTKFEKKTISNDTNLFTIDKNHASTEMYKDLIKSEGVIKKVVENNVSNGEVLSFTTPGNENMVNLATGDFSYSIPLLDVGGYPISINYNSQVGANDEASWVGLGWDLNAGSVNRTVRGLPDDFSGTPILKEGNLKAKETIGVGVGVDLEIAGVEALKGTGADIGLGLRVEYDNYDGFNTGLDLGVSVRGGNKNMGGGLGLNLGINSARGASYGIKSSMNAKFGSNSTNSSLGGYVGVSGTSREGIKSLNWGSEVSLSMLNHKAGDKKNYSGLYSGSSSFSHSFASPSYSPHFDFPMKTEFGSVRIKLGGEIFVVHPDFKADFSYSIQNLKRKTFDKKGFGYLYSHKATTDDLHDFNRANDGVYYRESPALPITAYTFDLYNVSAHGLSGSFRPKRNDIGIVHNAKGENTTQQGSGGGDIGGGNAVHVGVDVGVDVTQDIQRKWEDNSNQLANKLGFKDSIPGHPEYEPVYFFDSGEMTLMHDEEKFYKLGGFAPVSGNLNGSDVTSTLSNGTTITNPNDQLTYNRKVRNKMMSYQTIGELKTQGIDLTSHYGSEANNSDRVGDVINPSSNSLIGEITVLNESGIRYHFGLPAFNNFIKEASFRVNGLETEVNGQKNGNVAYTAKEASIENNSGEDNFFTKTTTPAHPYAWYVTKILSSDYNDVSLDGPTPDDLGSYTTFKYKKVHDNYQWRTPYQANEGIFNEGYKHTEYDNSATYIYGGKEIYYIDSIATRNYIAKFYSSRRSDAKGVIGEHGGIDQNASLYKLDKIELYSAYASKPEDLIPIKTVHFTYDYSLCKDSLTNSALGKLTLKGISFSYANSTKSKESPYVFGYSNNPKCHPKMIDRWGNYRNFVKENWPYANQIPAEQNKNAGAWLLTDITTPQNSTMTIVYESDSYAYVQDKKAAMMFEIIGATRSAVTGIEHNTIHHSLLGQPYLAVKAPSILFPRTTITNGSSSSYEEDYFSLFKDLKSIYFNAQVVVAPGDRDSDPAYENVKGFIDIDFKSGDKNKYFGNRPYPNREKEFYIYLPKANWTNPISFDYSSFGEEPIPAPTSGSMHPFTLAGREFIKYEKPKLIKPDPVRGHRAIEGAIEDLGSAMDELFSGSLENYFHNKKRCNYFDPEGSFIRLNHPTAKKLGGGARVKSITINDNWSKMQKSGNQGQKDAIYGTTYDYTTLENGNGREISSGVASYEPFLGKEENPLFQPLQFGAKKSMTLTANQFLYEPLGDILYPGPSVVYSKVTTKNIVASNGYSIDEFYTAKDFPTRFEMTQKQANGNETVVPIQVFKYSNTWESATQGFVVEVNDMHGKPRSHSEFDKRGNLTTKQETIYKIKNSNLDNVAKVINPKTLEVSDKIIGVDYDCIVDANQNYITLDGGGGQGNFDLSFAGPFPITSFMLVPTVNKFETNFRTLTITKQITRSAIVDYVQTQKFGSITQDKIIAYDQSTGSPIINEMDNEFEQNYRTINLPAHWAYPAMGHASKNQGLRLKNIRVRNGVITITDANKYFNEGDELVLSNSTGSFGQFWVSKIDNDTVTLIDASGKSEADYGLVNLYISRSGNKNILNASVGSMITMDNPISGGMLNINPSTKVLSASANTFSDYWHANNAFTRKVTETHCVCETDPVSQNKFRQHKDLLKDTLTNLIMQAPMPIYSFYIGDCAYTFISEDGSPIDGKSPVNNTCSIAESIRTFTNILQNLDPVDQFGKPYKSCSNINPHLEGSICQKKILIYSSCLALHCTSVSKPPQVICVDNGIKINPFINGILGNYRVDKSYFIQGKRTEGPLREAGFITRFEPFWKHENGHLIPNSSTTLWQRTDQVTVVDSRGNTLESLNALDIPSGANFQFGNSLMSASAVNASYTDIAYDGFEDITDEMLKHYTINGDNPSSNDNKCKIKRHFEISIMGRATIVNRKSHSGNKSLMIDGGTVSYRYELFEPRSRSQRANRLASGVFNLEKADITQTFAPKRDVKYYLSAWVHVSILDASTFADRATILINGQTLKPSGPIIDGWQQVTGDFILNTAFDMQIIAASGSPIWVDDIRIQPYNSNMKTYAYTSDFYRMSAILDDNNFATHYEYDAEGKLERVNKETQNGVYTLQDIRTELPKKH